MNRRRSVLAVASSMAAAVSRGAAVHTLTVSAVMLTLGAVLGGCSERDDEQARPATSSAAAPAECDRACLEGFIDRYVEALIAHDPARLPLAADVRFVENNQVLNVGDGTWRTMTGAGAYRHYFADVAASQAAMIGVLEENGAKVIYDLRLAIDGGQIAEIEAMVIRDPNGARLYEEHGAPHPKFLETVPSEERVSRAELTAVADKYLSGMQRNDPNGDYSFFHDDCDRWEHARQTTNHDPEAYGHSTDTVFVTLSCREQFETGFLGFVTRVRDRRYVVVDEERQTVFGFVYLDHDGTIREIPLSSGTTFVVPPYFSSPRTLQVGEAWRVEDGKLRQIEMTLTELPYGARSAFESSEDWLARDAAARPAPATAAAAAPCDRDCLIAFVDEVLRAMIAHEPALARLAPDVKYTENGQRLNPGDGLWGTATTLDSYRVYAADPASGTAGFYGTIVETDVPGLLALRLTVRDARVAEIEAVVFRQETSSERGGTLTLFAPRLPEPFDPARLVAADPAFAAPIDPPLPTADLERVVTGAIDVEAGQRLRERRTLVADPRVGVLLDLALIDVPNDNAAAALASEPASSGPYTVMRASIHKVRDGQIIATETAERPAPYGMRSGS